MSNINKIQSYLQKQYIGRISTNLPLFTWTGQKSCSFRCIVCGDSQKSTIKKRGAIYEREGDWFYKCHNCGHSSYFTSFLKEYFPQQYGEMLMENMKGLKHENISYHVEEKKIEAKDWEGLIDKLTDLGPQHEAMIYVKNRKIPSHQLNRIYYTDNFNVTYQRLAKLFNIKQEDMKHVPSMRAILFPFVDDENNLMFIQARFLDDAQMRYLTVKILDVSKIFGIEKINKNRDVFVFEGAFDSFFVDNSIATADADLTRSAEYVDKEKLILVYDNEPRSKIACKKIENALRLGFKVVIFPEWVKGKDINEMFLNGHDVQHIVETYHVQGMLGLLKHSVWKKC